MSTNSKTNMKFDANSSQNCTAMVHPNSPPPSSSSASSSHSYADSSRPRPEAGKVRRRGRSSSITIADLSCGTCGKTFSRRDNLMTHQRVHTDERPYKCTLCGKAFRWMSALRHHQDMHRRREQKMKQMQENCHSEQKKKGSKSKNEDNILDLNSEFAQFAPDAFDLGIATDRNKNTNTGLDISISSNKNLHPSIEQLFTPRK